ncbi:MAG: hypothetical protein WC637_19810, partial [Victivallales bacterium]
MKRIIITDGKAVPSAAIREIELSMREKLEHCESSENLQTGDIVLLSISHHLARQLIDRGLTELHNTTPETDAFHVLCANHVLYIIGSSKRGIMQGIHQLALNDEFRNFDEGIEHKGSSSMPFRAFALLDDGVFKDVSDAETIRSCVRYLSAMGASHVAATNDFSGGPEKMLHSFVPSRIFPNSTPPEFRSRLRGILRTIIDAAGEYGLDVFFDTALLPSCNISQREEFINAFSPDVV